MQRRVEKANCLLAGNLARGSIVWAAADANVMHAAPGSSSPERCYTQIVWGLTLSSTSAEYIRATRHFRMRATWMLWQVVSRGASFI